MDIFFDEQGFLGHVQRSVPSGAISFRGDYPEEYDAALLSELAPHKEKSFEFSLTEWHEPSRLMAALSMIAASGCRIKKLLLNKSETPKMQDPGARKEGTLLISRLMEISDEPVWWDLNDTRSSEHFIHAHLVELDKKRSVAGYAWSTCAIGDHSTMLAKRNITGENLVPKFVEGAFFDLSQTRASAHVYHATLHALSFVKDISRVNMYMSVPLVAEQSEKFVLPITKNMLEPLDADWTNAFPRKNYGKLPQGNGIMEFLRGVGNRRVVHLYLGRNYVPDEAEGMLQAIIERSPGAAVVLDRTKASEKITLACAKAMATQQSPHGIYFKDCDVGNDAAPFLRQVAPQVEWSRIFVSNAALENELRALAHKRTHRRNVSDLNPSSVYSIHSGASNLRSIISLREDVSLEDVPENVREGVEEGVALWNDMARDQRLYEDFAEVQQKVAESREEAVHYMLREKLLADCNGDFMREVMTLFYEAALQGACMAFQLVPACLTGVSDTTHSNFLQKLFRGSLKTSSAGLKLASGLTPLGPAKIATGAVAGALDIGDLVASYYIVKNQNGKLAKAAMRLTDIPNAGGKKAHTMHEKKLLYTEFSHLIAYLLTSHLMKRDPPPQTEDVSSINEDYVVEKCQKYLHPVFDWIIEHSGDTGNEKYFASLSALAKKAITEALTSFLKGDRAEKERWVGEYMATREAGRTSINSPDDAKGLWSLYSTVESHSRALKAMSDNFETLTKDMDGMRRDLSVKNALMKRELNEDITGMKQQLNEDITGMKQQLNERITGMNQQLNERMDKMETMLQQLLDANRANLPTK
ncbi:MAG: hypothetical protein ABW189_07775 [Rickettsiales bacterium]